MAISNLDSYLTRVRNAVYHNSHSPNTGFATAFSRFNRNNFVVVHNSIAINRNTYAITVGIRYNLNRVPYIGNPIAA